MGVGLMVHAECSDKSRALLGGETNSHKPTKPGRCKMSAETKAKMAAAQKARWAKAAK
jgi:hypothetical protein